MAGLLAELNFLFDGRSRRGVYANLRHVLPPETTSWQRWRTARQVFRHFACSVVDFFRIPKMHAGNLGRFVAEFRGWEHIQAAMDANVGVVFATVHIGSWELAGAYLGWRGIPLTVVALPHRDPRIDRLFLSSREATGMEVVPIGGAMRKLGEALTRGRLIALAVDRDVSRRGQQLPFFGQVARMPVGHAVLALNTGAWIIPGYVYRLPDGRSAIEIRPPIIPDPTSDNVETLTLRCLAVLEEFIRARPEQWAAFYDLWRDLPKQTS
jgi:KDO2-lipid IV(A) lauroyltransferase